MTAVAEACSSLLDLGQGRRDERLQDGERARGQGEDGERQAVVLAVGSLRRAGVVMSASDVIKR